MKISDIISKYSENPALRIITNTLPVIGPPIDLALSTYAEEIYKSRLEKIIEILHKEINQLKEEKINKEFIESEAFFDIFLLYLEKGIKTRQGKKVQYYARILMGAIERPKTIEQSEQEIEKISELSLTDLLVVKYMYDENCKDPELFENPDETISGSKLMKNIPNNIPKVDDFEKVGIKGMEKTGIQISVNNLSSVGFVKEYSGSAGNYGGGWYFITPLLKEIMQKISRYELKSNTTNK